MNSLTELGWTLTKYVTVPMLIIWIIILRGRR